MYNSEKTLVQKISDALKVRFAKAELMFFIEQETLKFQDIHFWVTNTRNGARFDDSLPVKTGSGRKKSLG